MGLLKVAPPPPTGTAFVGHGPLETGGQDTHTQIAVPSPGCLAIESTCVCVCVTIHSRLLIMFGLLITVWFPSRLDDKKNKREPSYQKTSKQKRY